MLPPYIHCDLSVASRSDRQAREESAVLFTSEFQIVKLVQAKWTAATVIFNFYSLIICQTIFITLIGTEMMFVMPVYTMSNLNINLFFFFLRGFCGFLGFMDFFFFILL